MYILVNPNNTEKAEGTPDNVDWEFAQKEIAQAKGFATGFGSGLSKGIFANNPPTSDCFLDGVVPVCNRSLGQYSVNFWMGVCCWDSETLTL